MKPRSADSLTKKGLRLRFYKAGLCAIFDRDNSDNGNDNEDSPLSAMQAMAAAASNCSGGL